MAAFCFVDFCSQKIVFTKKYVNAYIFLLLFVNFSAEVTKRRKNMIQFLEFSHAADPNYFDRDPDPVTQPVIKTA